MTPSRSFPVKVRTGVATIDASQVAAIIPLGAGTKISLKNGVEIVTPESLEKVIRRWQQAEGGTP